jgi:TonB family protein
MAHQPTLRPDPGRSQSADKNKSSPTGGLESIEGSAGAYLAELAATLASHGGGPSSTDLALDLLLNEIVEQALLATGATGAAIALARGNELVCRATTGANAPDLGVRLNTRSGLSGTCIQTGKVQRCDNTLTDPRVDTGSCRRLNVRSILVVPVLKGGEVLGVFETFSTYPDAFGEGDIQTLQALSRRIVDNVQHAAEAAATPAASAPANEAQPELSTLAIDLEPEPQDRRVRPRDYWTGLLTAIVILLAVFLGSMVGRMGWQTAMRAARTPSGATSPAQKSENMPSTGAAANADIQPVRLAAEKHPVRSAPPRASKPKVGEDSSSAGGLIVYEKGKVIFQMKSSEESQLSGTELANAIPSQDASTKESDASPASSPISVSPETAGEYLIHRVEPQYPEPAREQHIQGPVVLNALVGKDGSVEMLKVVSGDPQLIPAAGDAVRHWRFKPYRAHDTPVEFETQITVNFTLP